MGVAAATALAKRQRSAGRASAVRLRGHPPARRAQPSPAQPSLRRFRLDSAAEKMRLKNQVAAPRAGPIPAPRPPAVKGDSGFTAMWP